MGNTTDSNDGTLPEQTRLLFRKQMTGPIMWCPNCLIIPYMLLLAYQ